MKPLAILDRDDTILPTDYYRPLNRSADYDQHDEWIEESCYGGGPLDHLKWAPVWLVLGKVWWGKTYGEFIDFCKKGGGCRSFEAVRGELPTDHIVSSKKWERRHPLWYEGYLKRKKLTEKQAFVVGKYKGLTIQQVLKFDDGVDYIHWYAKNVNHGWINRIEEMFEGEKYKIYYEPKFRQYEQRNQV
jgi:hypothetical protein